jgi:uncharacterized coiled-coil DUF342 family protein
MKIHHALMLALALLAAAACNGGTIVKEAHGSKPDPIINMLHQGVIELNENIEELQQHIAELKQMPIDSDPQVQELQALDLASWQLHLQQWIVQRDNLVSSLDSIQQAQAAPQDKTAIGDQWSERRAQYMKTIEELRSNRRKIEQKRTDVESNVLGQYFK